MTHASTRRASARRLLGVWLVVVGIFIFQGSVRAAICPGTGQEAPGVVTIMVSKTEPATVGWIVSPGCKIEEVPILYNYWGMREFTVNRADIERVSSIPTDTDGLFLTVGGIGEIVFPDKLTNIGLVATPLSTLKGLGLPSALDRLDLSRTKLTALDFVLPPKLTSIILDGNSISKLERVQLPPSLSLFQCVICKMTTVRGVKWPDALTTLDLTSNTITNFEIRRSDLPILRRIRLSANIVQSKCADSTAELVEVNRNRVCVVEDDRFEAIYVNGNGVTPSAPTTPEANEKPTTTPSSSSSQAKDSSTGGSSTKDGGTNDATASPSRSSSSSSLADSTVSPRNENTTTATGEGSLGELQDDLANSPSAAPSDISKSRLSGETGPASNTASPVSSRTTFLLGICGGGAALMVVIMLFACLAKRRRAKQDDQCGNYFTVETPDVSSSLSTSTIPTNVYLSNDIRTDKALIPFRIEQSDLPLHEKIAQTNSSSVFKAAFQDSFVAVKQLLPGVWENKAHLSRFMDEIRTCARLDHHKIVTFIGIAWSSVRDLSVVMEFMPRGDLSTHLLRRQDTPTREDWSHQWAPFPIKTKTSIAQDVAEAVVYLHSFNNPILHRNLKARNVLLDNEGNAKLTGFGVSRESSIDDTMTGEVGTAAWIAPEVLRGSRYDEKADIYSFGVLMVELDRCQHPYASETAFGSANEAQASTGQRAVHSVAHKNTQIAVQVSSGKLRPSISSECPREVASLALQCLSFDPADRPTSMEVFYRLRRAQIALHEDRH